MSRKLTHFFIIIFAAMAVFSLVIKAGLFFYVRGKMAGEISRMLQVPVKIGKVSVTLPLGWLEVQNVKIFNPSGYREPTAFYIKRAWIDLGYVSSIISRQPNISTILLERPELSFEMKQNRQTNWSDLLAGLKKKPKKNSAGRRPDFLIDHIIIRDGRVIYWDEKMARPPARVVVKNIDINISRLNTRMAPDKMDSEFTGRAVVEPRTKIKLKGTGNFLKPRMDFDLEFLLEALELADFKPFFTSAKVKITRGEVATQVNLKCRNDCLGGLCLVNVRHLQLGKTGDIMDGLVDMMKSSGGVLQLKIPVGGTVRRPKVNVMAAIGDVLARQTAGAIEGIGRGVEGAFKGLFNIK